VPPCRSGWLCRHANAAALKPWRTSERGAWATRACDCRNDGVLEVLVGTDQAAQDAARDRRINEQFTGQSVKSGGVAAATTVAPSPVCW